MADEVDGQHLRRLIEAGRSLVAELDLDALLSELLAVASELTGARYAAVGVLDVQRQKLERFVTRGVDEETHRAIGALPSLRGIFGLLISDPQPLRLSDVGRHPRSYGFPPAHPPMHGFLGVPILIHGQAWGNLYLAKGKGDDFTDADEEIAVTLAAWAAIAIENARLYSTSESRRAELEQAVPRLEASAAIAHALGGETDLGRVLELIVTRAKALVDARAVVILLPDEEDFVPAASAGDVESPSAEHRIPIEGSTCGEVFRSGRPERFNVTAHRLRFPATRFGVIDARAGLLVPLVFRSRSVGVLAAFDRLSGEPEFTQDDESLMLSFAASAATAVATAQTVAADHLRRSLEAAEREGHRWAHELHDETLQALGGLQVLLSSALRRGDPAAIENAASDAVEQIGLEIEGLRTLIADLRPAALDEFGLGSAISSLAERVSAAEGLVIDANVQLEPNGRAENARLPRELETAAYRVIQEALTNVSKHAQAEHVQVDVSRNGAAVLLAVTDDGGGFDPATASAGFGLSGIRERVALGGGQLAIASSAEGTTISATLLIPPGTPRSSALPPRAGALVKDL